MSIINADLLGHAAARVQLNMSGVDNQNPVEIVEWRTEDNAAEELELFVFPYAINATRFQGDTSRTPQVYGNISFELQVTQGAPGSAQQWSTTDYLVQRAGEGHELAEIRTVVAPNLWLPDRGFRMRFTCTAARLRAVRSQFPVTCSIFAAFTPCSGMDARCVPTLAVFPQPESYPDPDAPGSTLSRNRFTPIPKGATEARVIAAAEGFTAVRWAYYDGSNVGGIEDGDPVADWAEWRPMPGSYVFVSLETYDASQPAPAGEIQFR